MIIQVRGDGYFPFPKHWPEDQLMFIVLFHTVLLVILIFRFAYLLITGRQTKPLPILPWFHLTTMGIIPIVALGAISGLHILQANYFHYVGYQMDTLILTLFLFLSLIPLAIYWLYAFIKKEFFPHLFLLSVLLSSLLIKGIPLQLFPITAKRSDMLPILKEAAISLFYWENPYQYYLLDNGVLTQNVRLPGLIMAYLPAAITGIDLRFVTLLFEMAIFLILLFKIRSYWKKANNSWEIIWAITFFIFLPYWHYRHELYETPFWFLLLITLLALHRGHIWGFTFALGEMIGTHQWGWLFAPFLLISLSRIKGRKPAVLSCIGVIALGGVILAIGVRSYYSEFYDHVFRYYNRVIQKGDFYPMSMYFTPYFSKLNLTGWLRPVQVLLQIPLLVLAYRYGNRIEAIVGVLALSLTIMLLFNPVAWTYQYLLVVFLLIMGLYFRNIGQIISR
jgi:hypothetical protein